MNYIFFTNLVRVSFRINCEYCNRVLIGHNIKLNRHISKRLSYFQPRLILQSKSRFYRLLTLIGHINVPKSLIQIKFRQLLYKFIITIIPQLS